MIKTEELMLGDWVLVCTDIQTVMCVVGLFEEIVYLEDNEENIRKENIKDISPIPLSESMLLDNGFKDHYKCFIYNNGRYDMIQVYLYNDKGAVIKILNEMEIPTSIITGVKYIHELQNILRSMRIYINFKI